MDQERIVIEVKEIRGKCPIYKVGDKLVVEKQRLLLEECTGKEVCIHSIASMLSQFVFVREGKGTVWVQCLDPDPPFNPEGGTVIFEMKKID